MTNSTLPESASTAPNPDARLMDKLERVSMHQNAGRFDRAGKLLDELLETHPDNPKLLHYKAFNLIQQGDAAAGEAMMKDALERAPLDPIQMTDLGIHYARTNRQDEALDLLRSAVEHAPNYAIARSNLGALLVLKQELSEAREHLKKAVELEPGLLDANTNLAAACMQQHDFAGAAEALFRALAVDPQSVKAHTMIAGALYRRDRFEAAEHHARRAIELAPQAWEAYLHLGNALASSGKLDEAAKFLRAICGRPPYGVAALSRLVHLRRIKPGAPELELIEQALPQADKFDDQRRASLYYAAGKAYDDIGRQDIAFGHFKAANDITNKMFPFDATLHAERGARLRDMVDAAFVAKHAGGGLDEVSPIFICGLPRSGTTLMDQMFSRHSQVQAGGELGAGTQALGKAKRIHAALEERIDAADLVEDDFDTLGEYYMASVYQEGIRSEHFTDKMPINYMYLGLLALALPKAKFIVMRRHPLDGLLSNYFQNFGANQPFSTDLGNLAAVYREYDQMVKHWATVLPDRMIELNYEDVVADPEGRMKEVLGFCGLEWEADVLDHTASSRQVNTASISQVREPIYKRAMARWRPYAPYIGDLAAPLSEYLSDEDKKAFN